ncbi:MAG: hypothetical protein H7318_19570 [Oligoflexus sp.]|nr:hypothetical protein [Oligoflexus sp.]
MISGRGSALNMEVTGAAVINGTKIQLWQDTNIDSQRWELIPLP